MNIDWHSVGAWWQAGLGGMAQPWVIVLVLALTTLLLEDVAIAAGVAVATHGSLSWEWALLAVGGGIALGDLGLYALGTAAQRVPLLRRRYIEGRPLKAQQLLQQQLPGAVLLARVVPGLRFVTYTACGFFRLPFFSFAAWVCLAVALWTLGLFWFSSAVGGLIAQHLGIPVALAVAIPVVVLALAVPLVRWARRPAPSSRDNGGMTAPTAPPFGAPAGQRLAPGPVPQTANLPHHGMPPLDQDGEPLSFFEFWPMWAFYPPVALYAGWLMLRYGGILLPTVANPSFPGGGFFGESKAEILSLLVQNTPEWVAPFVTVDRQALPDAASQPAAHASALDALTASAEQALAQHKLALPVVAKPDLGCRGAGVKLIRTREGLRAYLGAFPVGARLLLQQFVPFEGEAGVFYCRHPSEARGRIISITLKYFPYVHGDGQRTLRELILADPRAGKLPHLYLHRHAARLDTVPPQGEAIRLAFAGSHSRGAIFRNGTHLVTPEMEACFDAIAKRLPEFYFGRFDIRFEHFTDVQAGRGFTMVEANGAGAESTHIWDRKTGIFSAWADLMRQYRLLFQIGRANRNRGFKPLSLAEFRRWHRREKELTPLYPATD